MYHLLLFKESRVWLSFFHLSTIQFTSLKEQDSQSLQKNYHLYAVAVIFSIKKQDFLLVVVEFRIILPYCWHSHLLTFPHLPSKKERIGKKKNNKTKVELMSWSKTVY